MKSIILRLIGVPLFLLAGISIFVVAIPVSIIVWVLTGNGIMERYTDWIGEVSRKYESL